ncbi:MAG: hypothetical protein GKR88_04095 [Flavobacteriaceae bacterium]|nr:MAG: hypothetical protein GKR88_04095 [Flavobacteriaceae bacterium]
MKPSYKKQAVKRYVKMEKIKYRKYHIKDFNLIIKLIYPTRQVINVYHKLLEKTGSFSKSHLELINQTTKNFTVLNELHRDQDKYGRLYTVREDLNNAVYFLQNELELKEQDILLPASTRWFYKEIHWQFYDMVFTSKQAALVLRKSKSSVYRHLSELVDRELVEIVGKKRTAYVYQIKEKKE